MDAPFRFVSDFGVIPTELQHVNCMPTSQPYENCVLLQFASGSTHELFGRN
jgi:hypothetical protein